MFACQRSAPQFPRPRAQTVPRLYFFSRIREAKPDSGWGCPNLICYYYFNFRPLHRNFEEKKPCGPPTVAVREDAYTVPSVSDVRYTLNPFCYSFVTYQLCLTLFWCPPTSHSNIYWDIWFGHAERRLPSGKDSLGKEDVARPPRVPRSSETLKKSPQIRTWAGLRPCPALNRS